MRLPVENPTLRPWCSAGSCAVVVVVVPVDTVNRVYWFPGAPGLWWVRLLAPELFQRVAFQTRTLLGFTAESDKPMMLPEFFSEKSDKVLAIGFTHF